MAAGRPADYRPDWRGCLGVKKDRQGEKACGKVFYSQGPGMRLCGTCRNAQAQRIAGLSKLALEPTTDARIK